MLDFARLFGNAATAEPDLPEEPPLARRTPQRTVAHPSSILEAALAQKLLHGWMQNRYQTRYPLVLNLRNNTEAERMLLCSAVAQALRSSGAGAEACTRAWTWVDSLGGTAPTDDKPVRFDELRALRLVPQAYAICAGALGRRTRADRRYLEFLAARLDLPDDVARSLNRRFAA